MIISRETTPITDPQRQLELIIHPVRIRVLSALSRCPLTTAELDEAIPDVPRSSLYRHVRLLRDEGLIEETSREAAGGAPERRYKLTGAHELDPARLAQMSGPQHVEALTGYLMSVLARFSAVVGQAPRVDRVAERMGYREVGFWASDAEFDAAVAGMNAALLPLLSHAPAPERRARTLSTITFPTQPLGEGATTSAPHPDPTDDEV